MSKWGIEVPIFSHEILSSWLIRSSLVFGCDPVVLTKSLWPGERIWNTDIDRYLEPDKATVLLDRVHVSKETLFDTTLYSDLCKMAGSTKIPKTTAPWLIALGSQNRRRHGGFQACPVCLRSNLSPYFMKYWRYAWYTVCHIHKNMLMDRCPRCLFPIAPHLVLATDIHICVCPNCKYDYRYFEVDPSMQDLAQFQTKIITYLYTGTAKYGDEIIPLSDWFILLRFFINLIRKVALTNPKNISQLFSSMNLKVDPSLAPESGLRFELLPVYERYSIMSVASRLMHEQPGTFVELAIASEVSVETLCDSRISGIKVIRNHFELLPENRFSQTNKTKKKKNNQPCSKQIVERAWVRLKRRNHIET